MCKTLKKKKKKKNFMAPFYGLGSTASRRQFTFYRKFPEIPGTRFINLRMMKG